MNFPMSNSYLSMELKIEHPTKEKIIQVLECLLSGDLTRSQIREWQSQIHNTFDYSGPGTYVIPTLKGNDGYHQWLTLFSIAKEDELWMSPGLKQFLVRDRDIRFMLSELKEEPICEKVSENIEEYNHQCLSREEIIETFGDPPNPLISFRTPKKGNPFYLLGLKFYRMVLDNLHDLKEFSLFRYKGELFSVGLSVDTYSPYFSEIYGQTSSWPKLIELLDLMRISNEDIDWISDGLKGQKYLIRRMDDNGIEFDVAEFDNPITTSLKLKEYDGGIHKQTYWMEKA